VAGRCITERELGEEKQVIGGGGVDSGGGEGYEIQVVEEDTRYRWWRRIRDTGGGEG